jgi:hypothetical protein
MKINALATVAILAMTTGAVSANPPAPAFHPFVGAKKSATTKDGVADGAAMRSAQAQTIAAPLVSETRAVIAADGSLDIKCREVPNPRRRDSDDHAGPGPRR